MKSIENWHQIKTDNITHTMDNQPVIAEAKVKIELQLFLIARTVVPWLKLHHNLAIIKDPMSSCIDSALIPKTRASVKNEIT